MQNRICKRIFLQHFTVKVLAVKCFNFSRDAAARAGATTAPPTGSAPPTDLGHRSYKIGGGRDTELVNTKVERVTRKYGVTGHNDTNELTLERLVTETDY
jgi:hypothetical protein